MNILPTMLFIRLLPNPGPTCNSPGHASYRYGMPCKPQAEGGHCKQPLPPRCRPAPAPEYHVRPNHECFLHMCFKLASHAPCASSCLRTHANYNMHASRNPHRLSRPFSELMARMASPARWRGRSSSELGLRCPQVIAAPMHMGQCVTVNGNVPAICRT